MSRGAISTCRLVARLVAKQTSCKTTQGLRNFLSGSEIAPSQGSPTLCTGSEAIRGNCGQGSSRGSVSVCRWGRLHELSFIEVMLMRLGT